MRSQLRLAVFLVVIVLGCWECGSFRWPTTPSNLSGSESTPTPTPTPTPIPKPVVKVSSISVADVILETNSQRKTNGLSSLAENSKLNEAADFKMRDMFARQYFDHYGPDQTSGVAELLARFNYPYMMAGENLALGNFKNASELVALWMASPGHRANILNSIYRDIGVGIGYDVFKGRRTIIAVQIFGTPAR